MNCIKHKLVKARKEHRCELCYGKINKGNLYRNNITTDNGEIYNNHICENCDKLQNFLASKNCYNNLDWNEDDLFEVANDYVAEYLTNSKDYKEFIQFLFLNYTDDEDAILYANEKESYEGDADYSKILLRYLEFIKFETKEK